jgi:hypothetical protein
MNVELAGASEEVQYFGWALEHLPEGKTLSGLLVVPRVMPLEVAADRVRDVYRTYIYGDPISNYLGALRISEFRRDPLLQQSIASRIQSSGLMYVDAVPIDPPEVLSAPDQLYGADLSTPGPIDDLAYQAMLASFLGAYDGVDFAIRVLGTLLLRGSLNRQLTIVRFLSMLTRGQFGAFEFGTFESALPTKDQVVALAQRISRRDIRIEGRLEQIIESYANYASSSGSSGSG